MLLRSADKADVTAVARSFTPWNTSCATAPVRAPAGLGLGLGLGLETGCWLSEMKALFVCLVKVFNLANQNPRP